MKVTDKVVIVTGGASGIGKALVERFHTEGAAALIVADMNGSGAEAVAKSVGGIALQADVTKEADVEKIVRGRGQVWPYRPVLLQRGHLAW